MDPTRRTSLPTTGTAKTPSILNYFKPKASLGKTTANSDNKTITQLSTVHSKIRLSDACLPTASSRLPLAKKIKSRDNKPTVCNDIIFLSDSDDDMQMNKKGAQTSIQTELDITVLTEVPVNRGLTTQVPVNLDVFPESVKKDVQISRELDHEESEPEIEKLKESSPMDMSQFLDVLLEDSEDSGICIPESEESSTGRDYKFCNFRDIIDFVLNDLEHNSHLFDDSDWKVIESFTSLSVPAQRLYVRLFLRKHKWIRSNRIVYDEIAVNLDPVMNELTSAGLIEHCDSIDNLAEALELLDLNEVKSCARSVKASSGNSTFSALNQGFNNKAALIQSIMKHSKSSQSIKSHFTGKNFTVEEVVLNHVKKILGNTGYRISQDASGLFSRMTYLYFPPQVNEDENGVSISHEFYHQLLVSNGNMVYPEYSIAKDVTVYQSRQDLIDYAEACHLETQVLSAVEKKAHDVVFNDILPKAVSGFERLVMHDKVNAERLPIFIRNQTAGHVYTRCLSHAVASLEQSKRYDEALSVLRKLLKQKAFCHSYRGKWYERLAIDLGHLKRQKEIAEALLEGLSDDLVKLYFKFNLYLKAKKVLKKNQRALTDVAAEFADVEKCKHLTIESDTLSKPIPGKRTMFTNSTGTAILPVEEVALRYYKNNEGFSHGLHSESIIYHALMNVLLWDVIYHPLPDAFRFFHQNLPLDFVSEEFYQRRQELIEERLHELKGMSDAQVSSEIDRIWLKHNRTNCLIAWDKLSSQTLKELATCMGIHVLVPILKRMISNFRLNRSGFPDLILWDPRNNRVKAVEVKGPSDSLSGKQILWLDFFNSCGLPCEVCYVKAKTKA